MNDTSAALAVLIGLGVRLAVPILITVLAVVALARLDRHWQSEAGPAAPGCPKAGVLEDAALLCRRAKGLCRLQVGTALLAGVPPQQRIPGREMPGLPGACGCPGSKSCLDPEFEEMQHALAF